jgi:hypothetical protein
MAAGNKKESKKGEENMTRGQESEAGEPRKIAAAMVVGEGGKGGGGPGRPHSFSGTSGTSPRPAVAVARVSTPAVGPASRWRGVVGVAFSRVFGPGGGTVGGCQLPSCGICICCLFHQSFHCLDGPMDGAEKLLSGFFSLLPAVFMMGTGQFLNWCTDQSSAFLENILSFFQVFINCSH